MGEGRMSLFPIFLKLEDKRCLVVGAGTIGESRIRSLLVARARVHVIAPWATPAVTAWAKAGALEWSARRFELGDLDGIYLVVATTSSTEVNDSVCREAGLQGILCNVVDDPERCDFFYPAVVRRGDLQIASSTGGNSPALAQRLRREFEGQIAPVHPGWLAEIGRARKEMLAASMDRLDRRALLHAAASRKSFEADQTEPVGGR